MGGKTSKVSKLCNSTCMKFKKKQNQFALESITLVNCEWWGLTRRDTRELSGMVEMCIS